MNNFRFGNKKDKNSGNRLYLVDAVRGFAVIDMVLFHFCYDVFVIFMGETNWPYADSTRFWQRTICITFILISGFSFCLGRSHLKQAFKLLGTGALLTVVTYFFVPSLVIYYGIIFFLGEAALITAGLNKLLKGRFSAAGLCASLILFLVFYEVSSGTLNLFFTQIQLPEALYSTSWLVWLGFPNEGFYSSDYFGVFPWIFIYLTGYFIYNLLKEKISGIRAFYFRFPLLEFFGRHSYFIYLIHQPVCYIIAGLVFGNIFEIF